MIYLIYDKIFSKISFKDRQKKLTFLCIIINISRISNLICFISSQNNNFIRTNVNMIIKFDNSFQKFLVYKNLENSIPNAYRLHKLEDNIIRSFDINDLLIGTKYNSLFFRSLKTDLFSNYHNNSYILIIDYCEDHSIFQISHAVNLVDKSYTAIHCSASHAYRAMKLSYIIGINWNKTNKKNINNSYNKRILFRYSRAYRADICLDATYCKTLFHEIIFLKKISDNIKEKPYSIKSNQIKKTLLILCANNPLLKSKSFYLLIKLCKRIQNSFNKHFFIEKNLIRVTYVKTINSAFLLAYSIAKVHQNRFIEISHVVEAFTLYKQSLYSYKASKMTSVYYSNTVEPKKYPAIQHIVFPKYIHQKEKLNYLIQEKAFIRFILILLLISSNHHRSELIKKLYYIFILRARKFSSNSHFKYHEFFDTGLFPTNKFHVFRFLTNIYHFAKIKFNQYY
uniref:Uncharacterized protein n=1 Tax=Amorphochlora amoebiformis TaxID=1561963 RepID=A0A0H5BQY9_9EUKA|nr:hypothetical protein [Amorphochlora amoebiformis]